jgi:tRNA dimethylallyltransferase
LIRALEICLLSRRPASSVFAAGSGPLTGFAPLKLVLLPDRESLRARILDRTRQMFAAGLVDEARRLPPDAKPLEAIGYKEARAVAEGRLSQDEALRLTFFATCQYAKRQVTWFRREPGALILHGFGGDPSIQHEAARLLRAFLESLPASAVYGTNPACARLS